MSEPRHRPGARGPLSLLPWAVLIVLGSDLGGVLLGGRLAARACPAAEAALVMGAAQYDGRPSPAFARRLDRAAGLHRDGCVKHVWVSGGQAPGARTSEGEAGARYLVKQGLPPEAVHAETEARSSLEAVRNTAPALAARSVVLVTDDLHAWRTATLAAREGWRDVRVATVPAGGARGRYALREWVALSAYRSGWIR